MTDEEHEGHYSAEPVTMIGGRPYPINPKKALPQRLRHHKERIANLVAHLQRSEAAKAVCKFCGGDAEPDTNQSVCESCSMDSLSFLQAAYSVTSYNQVGYEWVKFKQFTREYRGDETKWMDNCATCGTIILVDKFDNHYKSPTAEFCSADCYEAMQEFKKEAQP